MKEDVNKHAYKNLEKATSVKMQQQSNSNPSVKETEGRNFLNILMLQFYLFYLMLQFYRILYMQFYIIWERREGLSSEPVYFFVFIDFLFISTTHCLRHVECFCILVYFFLFQDT